MKYPFDQPRIRLYNYYFFGIPKPITIQARDKAQARAAMKRYMRNLPPIYQQSKIIGETVIVPVFGVSERQEEDRTMVWVGKGISSTGWIEKSEFEKKYKH